MKIIKQLAYIPCSIQNSDCEHDPSYFFKEKLFLLVGGRPELGWYLGAEEFSPHLTTNEKATTSWLKPQESFVFTAEELNAYISDVIHTTLGYSVLEPEEIFDEIYKKFEVK